MIPSPPADNVTTRVVFMFFVEDYNACIHIYRSSRRRISLRINLGVYSLKAGLLTGDGVIVGDRSVERYDLVKIKLAESEAEHPSCL